MWACLLQNTCIIMGYLLKNEMKTDLKNVAYTHYQERLPRIYDVLISVYPNSISKGEKDYEIVMKYCSMA